MNKPTAVVVDDATFIRRAFPVLMPLLDVGCTFSTAEELLQADISADVVVLELQSSEKDPMEVRAGITALRDVVAAGHVVCVYTQEDRPFVHAACLASGAAGVVLKSATVVEAQDAFVEVAGGGGEFPAELLGRIEQLSQRGGLGMLSPRKRRILSARAQGMSLIQIAAQLDEPEALAIEEWHVTARALRQFLSYASLGMVCRQFGLDAEDLPDIWSTPFPSAVTDPRDDQRITPLPEPR